MLFRSVEEFDKYLEEEYGYGLQNGYEDAQKFLAGKEFEVDFESSDELVIILEDGSSYYMCERYDGCCFVRID